MPNPTPGETAYAAYATAFRQTYPGSPLPWSALLPTIQACWEAAAQAVLAPRLTNQAAQFHHLIDYVLEHAPQAYLDKVHIWLTDLSGIVQPEGNCEEDNARREADHA